jgi:hypothetical protein
MSETPGLRRQGVNGLDQGGEEKNQGCSSFLGGTMATYLLSIPMGLAMVEKLVVPFDQTVRTYFASKYVA